MFFANTGQHIYNELAQTIFVDEGLCPTLLNNGYLQFGRAAGGLYDPVCFATKRGKRGDAPIVCIDHEEILIKQRLRIVEEISFSFTSFLEGVVAGGIKLRRAARS